MNPTDPNNPNVQPTPTEPTSPAPAEPVAPAPQPAEAPVSAPLGAPTGPIASAGPTAPEKKPFPKKLVIILGAVVGGLVILGVAAFLLVPVLTGGSNPIATLTSAAQPMKTYQGNGYSALVPEKFVEKVGASGQSVTFSEDAEAKNKSSVLFSSDTYNDVARDQIITQLKEAFSEESFNKAASQTSDVQEVKNYKSTELTVDGQEAYKLSYDAYQDGIGSGTVTMVYVFGQDKYYTILITVVNSDPALSGNVDKIINSFKIQ